MRCITSCPSIHYLPFVEMMSVERDRSSIDESSWSKSRILYGIPSNELRELRLQAEKELNRKAYVIVQQTWITLHHWLLQDGYSDPDIFFSERTLLPTAIEMLKLKGCLVEYDPSGNISTGFKPAYRVSLSEDAKKAALKKTGSKESWAGRRASAALSSLSNEE